MCACIGCILTKGMPARVKLHTKNDQLIWLPSALNIDHWPCAFIHCHLTFQSCWLYPLVSYVPDLVGRGPGNCTAVLIGSVASIPVSSVSKNGWKPEECAAFTLNLYVSNPNLSHRLPPLNEQKKHQKTKWKTHHSSIFLEPGKLMDFYRC